MPILHDAITNNFVRRRLRPGVVNLVAGLGEPCRCCSFRAAHDPPHSGVRVPRRLNHLQPVICLVTDRRRLGASWEEALLERIRIGAQAGVHLIQVRERDLEARDLWRLVRGCVEAVHGTRARVVVNDRLDVALAAGAHGVHLPASGLAPTAVRAIAPAGFLIGRSVHEAHEAELIAREGAVDYLVFGTVYSSASKPDTSAVGEAALAAAAAAAAPVPVLAIGGITSARMARVAAAGASGFAAIGWFADGEAADVERNVQQALSAFDTLPPIGGGSAT